MAYPIVQLKHQMIARLAAPKGKINHSVDSQLRDAVEATRSDVFAALADISNP
jgi:hypothetical protein